MSKHLVFVYGTLKHGFMRHGVLLKSQKIGEDSIKGTMLNLGAFPGVVLQGDDTIHGEVYLVDERTLEALDAIEGHPHFYRRVRVPLDCKRKHVYTHSLAWVYTLPEAYLQERQYDHIQSGVWQGV